jgi:hypothetical protein
MKYWTNIMAASRARIGLLMDMGTPYQRKTASRR